MFGGLQRAVERLAAPRPNPAPGRQAADRSGEGMGLVGPARRLGEANRSWTSSPSASVSSSMILASILSCFSKRSLTSEQYGQ